MLLKLICTSVVLNETANATTVWHYATVLKEKLKKKSSRKKLL